MRILSAELHDYLSFRDCPPIEFREGINLVVGVNNSGKSALLKALNPNLPAHANRSEERFRESELPSPKVTLTIRTSGERVRQAALDQGGEFFIPTPANNSTYEDAQRFLKFFFENKNITVRFQHHATIDRIDSEYPSHSLFSRDPNGGERCALMKKQNGKLRFGSWIQNQNDSLPDLLPKICGDSLFYFSAERLNIGASGFGNVRRLSHNADNLPAFLLTLMGERVNRPGFAGGYFA